MAAHRKKIYTKKQLKKIALDIMEDREPEDDDAVISSGERDSNGNIQSDSEEDEVDEELYENEVNSANDFTWEYTPTWTPKVHDFEESNSGIQNKNITDTSTALKIFLEFMNEEIINKIVLESNNYYQQTIEKDINMKQNMRNLGPDEFMCFLGIVLLMSRVKKLEIHEYWSTNTLIETPMFAKVMKRDRFKLIKRILHFRNNNEQSSDRVRKISSMTTVLKEIFPKNFTPYQNLCIDKSLLLFKGRLLFKQYIPSKRSRFRIKMFIISDCKTGYILDFIIYSGSTTEITSNNPELGKSGQIVLTLMNNYLYKGHCLYIDNWYSSPLLFQYLHQQQVNACGIVKKIENTCLSLVKNYEKEM
ncbi:piggyBac transposable element-derived protein 4-like [Onthophagus taurus]|uniref:piggyBac transposable element-derived protein 4-like n=1 Tax=Onthophagus taurus TaxID=166361 RepID=UPI0039BDE7EA